MKRLHLVDSKLYLKQWKEKEQCEENQEKDCKYKLGLVPIKVLVTYIFFNKNSLVLGHFFFTPGLFWFRLISYCLKQHCELQHERTCRQSTKQSEGCIYLKTCP